VCPEDAISEGDGKYVIDQELCMECLSCLDECPNDAIVEM
jgi:Fe-S-cluster-containing hydrogenase component 2